jgi:AcrR family transcriptional regulator
VSAARSTPGSPGRGAETRQRILETALQSFGTRGIDATSLDAVAAELGIRKQTILYYFPSKHELLGAVLDVAAGEVVEALEAAIRDQPGGFARVEALVRQVFRVALRRPELLGLVRELSRTGGEGAERFTAALEPLAERAAGFLEAEMDAGVFRRSDPRLLLVSCYASVIGVATEVEALRAVGIEPSLRATVRRRCELLAFLRSALIAAPPARDLTRD